MKTIEELYKELKTKIDNRDPNSGSVKEFDKGVHFIGKKIIEEAGEVWIAAEYEGKEKTAEEMSQLIYHNLIMAIKLEITLDDIYKYL